MRYPVIVNVLTAALALTIVAGCQNQPNTSQLAPVQTEAGSSATEPAARANRPRPDRSQKGAQSKKQTASQKASSEKSNSTKSTQVNWRPEHTDVKFDKSAATGRGSARKQVNDNWLRGDDEKRARLRGLESSARPPAIRLSNWKNSHPLNFGNLDGKIVVLDFWATWCGPCINSIEFNNEMHQRYKDRGVVVIGACCPDGSDQMQEIVREHGIQYPVAVDQNERTGNSYKVVAYPSYYLIDRSGELRIADCRAKYVEEAIEFLLDEQPKTRPRSVSGFRDPNTVTNPFFSN